MQREHYTCQRQRQRQGLVKKKEKAQLKDPGADIIFVGLVSKSLNQEQDPSTPRPLLISSQNGSKGKSKNACQYTDIFACGEPKRHVGSPMRPTSTTWVQGTAHRVSSSQLKLSDIVEEKEVAANIILPHLLFSPFSLHTLQAHCGHNQG